MSLRDGVLPSKQSPDGEEIATLAKVRLARNDKAARVRGQCEDDGISAAATQIEYNRVTPRAIWLRKNTMKSRWETHKGIRYFYFDLSGYGMDDEVIIREMDEADAVIMAEPLDSVLVLNDVRYSVGSYRVVRHLQVSAERSTPYINKAAAVGVSGVQKVLLEVVNRFAKRPILAFDDIERAKDWLVEGAELLDKA